MDPRPGTPFCGDEVPDNKILEAFRRPLAMATLLPPSLTICDGEYRASRLIDNVGKSEEDTANPFVKI
jgi:hypothetical protein